MKFSNVFTALSVVSLHALSNALPMITRTNGPAETDVLNFALALEHLENAFYDEGLKKFSPKDFADAGFPNFAFGRYKQILGHEASHVTFLAGALGDAAVKPCEYSFPYDDVKGFVALSDMLETIGSSAYTGAAKLLSTPGFLTAAASILSTESRQSAFISSAVRGLNPWSTEFEAPLDVNQAFTLAAGLIKSCPPEKHPLIAKANPPITVEGKQVPGSKISLKFTPSSDCPELFAAFISGLSPVFVPIKEENGAFHVEIPKDLIGVTFLVITNDGTKADDTTTVAGPAFLNFRFDENGKVIA